MGYTLKKGPAFEVTDGKFAGVTFKKGIEYSEVPEGMGHRFQKVSKTPAPVKTNLKKKVKDDELGQSKA